MTIDDIKALIASDESRTLELKKSTGELKDGMHAACAFLNTEGGWLIFGITPKSLKIVGLWNSNRILKCLINAAGFFSPCRIYIFLMSGIIKCKHLFKI